MHDYLNCAGGSHIGSTHYILEQIDKMSKSGIDEGDIKLEPFLVEHTVIHGRAPHIIANVNNKMYRVNLGFSRGALRVKGIEETTSSGQTYSEWVIEGLEGRLKGLVDLDGLTVKESKRPELTKLVKSLIEAEKKNGGLNAICRDVRLTRLEDHFPDCVSVEVGESVNVDEMIDGLVERAVDTSDIGFADNVESLRRARLLAPVELSGGLRERFGRVALALRG